MVLQNVCRDTLTQLSDLLKQLDEMHYSQPLTLLSDNTIGKHSRHILEFYETMLNGISAGEVDYDSRQRNLLLETDIEYTLQRIEFIKDSILQITSDQELNFSFSYAKGQVSTIKTNLYREMNYNIEHTIHHLAIIKIAVCNSFPNVHLPITFGVAYSTLQYQQECAQ